MPIFGRALSAGTLNRLVKVFLYLVLWWARFPKKWVCLHLDKRVRGGSAGCGVLEEFERAYRKLAE